MFCAKRQTRTAWSITTVQTKTSLVQLMSEMAGNMDPPYCSRQLIHSCQLHSLHFHTADWHLDFSTMLLLAGWIRNSEECHLLTLLSAHWKLGRWHFSRVADHFPTVHWNDAIFIQLIIICPACGEQTPFYKQLISCLTARKAIFIPEQLMTTLVPEFFLTWDTGCCRSFSLCDPWSTTVYTVLSYYNVLSTHSCG